MANDAPVPERSERGFSLIEMLVVVGIIMVMAAVALPNIGQYIRNYKISGAAQEVAGELQSARSKAIMTNTNAGVSFVAVDADSYRFVQEDLPAAEQLSPLRDLPIGVRFVAATIRHRGPVGPLPPTGGLLQPGRRGHLRAGRRRPVHSRRGLDALQPGERAPTSWPRTTRRCREGSCSPCSRRARACSRTVRLAPGGRVLPQP